MHMLSAQWYFVYRQWHEVTFLQPFFAFSYKERFDVNGWDIYDPEKEFQRQVSQIYIILVM